MFTHLFGSCAAAKSAKRGFANGAGVNCNLKVEIIKCIDKEEYTLQMFYREHSKRRGSYLTGGSGA